jgi:hypothetical protein
MDSASPGASGHLRPSPRHAAISRPSPAREQNFHFHREGPSAGHEGSLHLGHFGYDRHAGVFVQYLDAEDLHRGGRAQLRRTGQGDVERQDLIGVPGFGNLLHAVDRRHRRIQGTVQGGDRSAGGGQSSGAADERALEDCILRQIDVLVGIELGTDVIDVGDELAAQLPYQIQ